MVKKNSGSKKEKKHKKNSINNSEKLIQIGQNKFANTEKLPSINVRTDADISMDFATKAYERFNKIIKSIILFGSAAKRTTVPGSDIDIIILLDDVSIDWTQELIFWYREELDKLMKRNPYKKNLHINTIKLSTWWDDLMRGDPVVINIIRYGESLIDFGGFFEPLKFLLLKGKIRSTPEAIYSCLERVPQHFLRSKMSELGSIEGLYWAMVDSAHAALISRNVLPPSPEHVPLNLKETFVVEGSLKMKYVTWYRDLLFLHKKISHGEMTDLKGIEVDMWQQRTQEFISAMAKLVNDTLGISPADLKENDKVNLGLETGQDKDDDSNQA